MFKMIRRVFKSVREYKKVSIYYQGKILTLLDNKLYDGEEVKFDLTANQPCFEMKKNFTYNPNHLLCVSYANYPECTIR